MVLVRYFSFLKGDPDTLIKGAEPSAPEYQILGILMSVHDLLGKACGSGMDMFVGHRHVDNDGNPWLSEGEWIDREQMM